MSKHNEQSLKNVIQEMIDAYGIRERYEMSVITENWEKWMGKTIARHTTDIYLNKRRLYIYVNSGPLKQELNAGRSKIISIINDHLGKKLVDEVIIK